MSRPQAVIFDIGNVLIGWEPLAFYDRTIGPEARARLFAEVDMDAMNAMVDAGAPLYDTVLSCAEDYPHWSAEIMLWHDRWAEMLTPVIEPSVRLLHALKAKGVPVFALSNFGAETFERTRQGLPFLNAFDRSYISGRLGVNKPDPRIYEIVEADCGLPPGDLLFTDDRADNIAAAAARGWQTHLFTGPEPFARRLVAAGLLNESDLP